MYIILILILYIVSHSSCAFLMCINIVKYSTKVVPRMFLTHCPIHPREFEDRVVRNLHGHLHEHVVLDDKGEPDPRYICVSCEQLDYTPKLISELIK